jgi:hypothetical protein
MTRCLPGRPVSTKCWRASFSAASSRLRTAAEDVGAVHAVGLLDEPRGELLDGLVGERGATDIRDAAGLACHGLTDLMHSVADAGDEGATHGVEVALPVLVLDPAPLAAHGQRKLAREVPIEDRRIRVPMHGRECG